jgi:hypothetical protein
MPNGQEPKEIKKESGVSTINKPLKMQVSSLMVMEFGGKGDC